MRCHILVMAAGLSTRMAPRNKLLMPDATGAAMGARVAAACCASSAVSVGIVLGHQAGDVRTAISAHVHSPKLTWVTAADHAAGLAASLKAGLMALPADDAPFMVCLADMPLITPAMIDSILHGYDEPAGRLIVVPTCGGARGNPVLWDRRFIPAMMDLQGDTGARALLRQHAGQVFEVELADQAVLRDFDTIEAFS